MVRRPFLLGTLTFRSSSIQGAGAVFQQHFYHLAERNRLAAGQPPAINQDGQKLPPDLFFFDSPTIQKESRRNPPVVHIRPAPTSQRLNTHQLRSLAARYRANSTVSCAPGVQIVSEDAGRFDSPREDLTSFMIENSGRKPHDGL